MSLAKTAAEKAREALPKTVHEARRIHARSLPAYHKEHAELTQQHAKNIDRANTAARFISNYALGTVTKPIGMAVGGAVTSPALLMGPAGIPIVAKGMWKGRQLAGKANDMVTRPLVNLAVRKAGAEAIHHAAVKKSYKPEDLQRLKEIGPKHSKKGFELASAAFKPKAESLAKAAGAKEKALAGIASLVLPATAAAQEGGLPKGIHPEFARQLQSQGVTPGKTEEKKPEKKTSRPINERPQPTYEELTGQKFNRNNVFNFTDSRNNRR